MSSYFWEGFFSDCSFVTNCRILSGDKKIKETHKLFLSAISDDLRSYLLSSADPTEEATILLPDFSMEEIEEMFSKVFSAGENQLFEVLGLFQYSKAVNKVKPEKPKVTEYKVKSEHTQDGDNNDNTDKVGHEGTISMFFNFNFQPGRVWSTKRCGTIIECNGGVK